MRVLITGADGQLGRALRDTAPEGELLFPLARGDCDITDENAVSRALDDVRPDLVINVAAYTAVDRAEQDEAGARAVNTAAVGILASHAARHGARLVQVSTDYVFDGESGRAYAPRDATSPLSAYGRSKRDGEVAALAGDPRNLVVRTAWLYGRTGGNFVRTMLRAMAERGTVRVVADQIGTPTFAPSLANGLWGLVAAEAGGIHHYTDSGVASWYDFAVAIAEEAGAVGMLSADVDVIPITTAEYPTAARRPACAVLDKSACWRMLGRAAPHWRANLCVMLREVADHG